MSVHTMNILYTKKVDKIYFSWQHNTFICLGINGEDWSIFSDPDTLISGVADPDPNNFCSGSEY